MTKFTTQFLSLSIFALLTLTGCSTVSRNEPADNKLYLTVQDAASGVKPITSLVYGRFVNVKISDFSPALSIGKSSNRYEVASVNGKEKQPFSISVTSICDCLGFNKWQISPIAYLTTSTGEIVASSPIQGSVIAPLSGVFPKSAEYRVVVIANAAYTDRILYWLDPPE